MKVDGTRPIGGPEPIRKERDASSKYETAAHLGTSAPSDSISVAGIPESELTPRVRAAIGKLMQEVNDLRQEMEHARKRIAYLERIADQDTMLPVYNRRAFVRELNRAISYSGRYDDPTSLAFFDLNGFKEINDTYGHRAGDEVLKAVAGLLLDHTRESDAVGRLGGDEFGLILWRTESEEAKQKSLELSNAIAALRVDFDGHQLGVGAAYGTATFRGGRSVEDILADADEEMYRNKAASKSGDNVR